MKTALWCVAATAAMLVLSPVYAEGASIDEVKFPVPINGMQTDFLRCKSAEKEVAVDITIALRDEVGDVYKLMAFAYDGTVFRFWEMKASRGVDGGRDLMQRNEWYFLEGEWVLIDLSIDQTAFWDSYARDYFGTTGNDLTDFNHCVFYQPDAS